MGPTGGQCNWQLATIHIRPASVRPDMYSSSSDMTQMLNNTKQKALRKSGLTMSRELPHIVMNLSSQAYWSHVPQLSSRCVCYVFLFVCVFCGDAVIWLAMFEAFAHDVAKPCRLAGRALDFASRNEFCQLANWNLPAGRTHFASWQFHFVLPAGKTHSASWQIHFASWQN